jgi:predicted AAA+ superfamily ATPase
MLKSVSESMAGRVAILNLHPMTFLERENTKDIFWIEAYLEFNNEVQFPIINLD